MSTLSFYWPWAGLLLLALVPWYWLKGTKHDDLAYVRSYLTEVIATMLGSSPSSKARQPLNWGLLIIWLLLVLALMRPQLVGQPIEISRNGRNIMLVLDISESMEQQDLNLANQPADRLRVAKAVLLNFIDQRIGDRLGLVVFGSEAFLHAPLSFDRTLIKQLLLEAQIGFAGPKTAIGDAIGLGLKKLINLPEGERLLLLLTDGQNNSGNLEPSKAAELAYEHKVKLYIVGMGASRMLVNSFFGKSAVNPSEDLEAAEPELKNMAQRTGGLYFRAKDSEGLLKIYQEIDRLEPIKIDNQVLVPRKELFYWPATMILVLIVGFSLERRRPWARV